MVEILTILHAKHPSEGSMVETPLILCARHTSAVECSAHSVVLVC